MGAGILLVWMDLGCVRLRGVTLLPRKFPGPGTERGGWDSRLSALCVLLGKKAPGRGAAAGEGLEECWHCWAAENGKGAWEGCCMVRTVRRVPNVKGWAVDLAGGTSELPVRWMFGSQKGSMWVSRPPVWRLRLYLQSWDCSWRPRTTMWQGGVWQGGRPAQATALGMGSWSSARICWGIQLTIDWVTEVWVVHSVLRKDLVCAKSRCILSEVEAGS